MLIGYVPGAVRVPTFQLHDTLPVESAVVGARPCAVEGPLL